MDIIEIIGKATDSIGKFLDDLVAAWRKGDRRKVLLVGFVVLFLFGVSQQGWFTNIPLLNNIPQLPQESPWLLILWILVGLLFMGVIYESIKPPSPEPLPPTEFKESTAIKGLRSFTEKDREIFKQLQRNQVLQECLAEINRDKFRFGILFGESGCGKTSFIQAGLIPQLNQAESKVQGIYVRFSERDPLVTIRQAFVDQLPPLPEDLNQLEFLPLLSQGVEAASKPLVLVFDQFEQFFVHFKRKEDRQFFIQALADWYQNSQLQVKILVSMRKDFYAYLLEIQKAFGNSYVLSPQEAIELEKFSPEEATNVIEVIAKTTEGLTIDRQFIQQIAAQELVSGEDGLISPVDLQLLAWIINGQKTTELRAFNEKAFQKLGGIEGLLTKFLERSLQTRITDNQRQTTIKVLRSLTDAERRVRAGTLTFEEIDKKLPDISVKILQEAINWLQADGVRLITPVERSGVIGYELAHEKMIPALLKLVDKELPEADKANQLLERRVNEWLSNNCDVYYLLRWRELQLINKQKPYLKWGINRQQKEKLISASKRRFQRLFVSIISFLVVLGLFWLGTVSYLATDRGEIQQVRWELNRLSEIVGNDDAAKEIAVAIAKDGNFQQAQKIIANQIDDSRYKVDPLRAIAETIGQLNQPQQAGNLLEQALTAANQIDYLSDKVDALSAIAEAYGQLNQPQQASQLLEQALTAANQIDNSTYKAEVLIVIAKAMDQLTQPSEGIKLLEDALFIANQIDNSTYNNNKAQTLIEIAKATVELNQPQEGIKLLRDALTSANHIDNSTYNKATVLIAIAKAIDQLNQPQEAIKLLQDALITAKQINNSFDALRRMNPKAKTLTAIVEAIGELNQPQEGIALLQQALTIANQTDDPSYTIFTPLSPKAETLIAIADTYVKINQPQEAIKLLQDALSIAHQIKDVSSNLLFVNPKVQTLIAIAKATVELNQPQEGIKLLRDALTSANHIDDSSDKVSALRAIAKAYAQLGNWGEARRVSNTITIQDEKAKSLAQVLNIWNEKQK